jgi:DNA-binding transcriptional LysR family regulator
MEMHQIRYFLAVARALNFTRAAEQCNVTQPSLTRAIQKLEDEFGGPLFNRERSLTHLTELGRMVLPHLEQTFDAAEAATSLANSMGRAEVAPLVIGLANGLTLGVLEEILIRVGAALPGLAIDLRRGTSEELVEQAMKGGIDLLLVALSEPAQERLESWPLFVQGYRIATWSGHHMTDAGPPRLADIAAEPWIDCADDATALWRRVITAANIAPDFRHRVAGGEVALRLVARAMGCAIVAADCSATGITLTRIADCDLDQPIMLSAVSGRRRGRAADAFVRVARARHWQAGSAPVTDQPGL